MPMYCQKLLKDEWNGYAYEDMGLEGFFDEELRKTDKALAERKAESFRDAERRATRSKVAEAFLDQTISARAVTIHSDRYEVLDVIVVGDEADLKEIPEEWHITLERSALGIMYENVLAWMTMKDDKHLFILRADDEKGFFRLEQFLRDGIEFVKRLREAA